MENTPQIDISSPTQNPEHKIHRVLESTQTNVLRVFFDQNSLARTISKIISWEKFDPSKQVEGITDMRNLYKSSLSKEVA